MSSPSKEAIEAAVEAMKTPLGWGRGVGPGDGTYNSDVHHIAVALDAFAAKVIDRSDGAASKSSASTG